MGTVILNPSAAADVVCHEEQLRIWAEEITGSLSMAGYIREDMSYDDVIDIGKIVEREIKSIVEMAFDHPEARTICRT